MARGYLWLAFSVARGFFPRCGVNNDVCPWTVPPGSPKTLNKRLTGLRVSSLEEVDGAEYDYVVIGGGGAGCSFARALSEGTSEQVLVVERGGQRKDHRLTQDIYGSGMVIGDDHVSQLVVTKNGVRTHVGNVLGGGTTTGMSIVIEEDRDYIEAISNMSKTRIDFELYQEALEWLRPIISTPMIRQEPYSSSLVKGLMQEGYKIDHGPSSKIHTDGTWGGYSMFNKSDHFFRNSADVLLGGDGDLKQPPNLHVVTNALAVKILFDQSETPRARCALLRTSTRNDRLPKDGRMEDSARKWWREALKGRPLLQAAKRSFYGGNFGDEISPEQHAAEATGKPIGESGGIRFYKVCAKKEIVLSAGALYTPALLAQSGVGNSMQLEELGMRIPPPNDAGRSDPTSRLDSTGRLDPIGRLDPTGRSDSTSRSEAGRLESHAESSLNSGAGEAVRVIEGLGRNLVDRGLLPVAFFRDERSLNSDGLIDPQVCGVIGLAKSGQKCENFKINQRNRKCTIAGFEEMTGSRILDGFITATRILFPRQVRSSPLVDAGFMVVNYCGSLFQNTGSSLGPYPGRDMEICNYLKPFLNCMKRVSAVWYFVNEPKSRGSVKLLSDGNLLVDPRYYQHPQDIQDGMRGLRNLIRLSRNDAFESFAEKASNSSCPVIIASQLRTLYASLAHWSSHLTTHAELNNIIHTWGHAKGAWGYEERRNDARKRNETRRSEYETRSGRRDGRRAEMDLSIFSESLDEVDPERRMIAAKKALMNLRHALETPGSDELNRLWPWDERGPPVQTAESVDTNVSALHRFPTSRGAEFASLVPLPWPRQGKYATFPPQLPEPDDESELKLYISAMMQSMWHLAGTAALGSVVDSQFRVKGIDGLSIVDASVLPQTTRLNPTQTILGLARYAGLLKAKGVVP